MDGPLYVMVSQNNFGLAAQKSDHSLHWLLIRDWPVVAVVVFLLKRNRRIRKDTQSLGKGVLMSLTATDSSVYKLWNLRTIIFLMVFPVRTSLNFPGGEQEDEETRHLVGWQRFHYFFSFRIKPFHLKTIIIILWLLSSGQIVRNRKPFHSFIQNK